jgi:GMP synthase-like glutamine amidotransferase
MPVSICGLDFSSDSGYRDGAVARMTSRADVLICVADGVLYGDFDYSSRISERLSEAGLRCDRVDLTSLPGTRLPSARAYVFTGGETAANSEAQWMRSAIDTAARLVTNAERGDYSVIGICLGSQILAEALRPGSLVWSPAIEVGLTPVTRPEHPEIQRIVPSFHYQAISQEINSVSGVRVEWGNEHTAVQAFSYGKRTVGYQFHPELSATDVDQLIDRHSDVITKYGGDPAAAHRSVRKYAGALSADLFHNLVTERVPA